MIRLAVQGEAYATPEIMSQNGGSLLLEQGPVLPYEDPKTSKVYAPNATREYAVGNWTRLKLPDDAEEVSRRIQRRRCVLPAPRKAIHSYSTSGSTPKAAATVNKAHTAQKE
jgi:hypothetical protein